MSHTRSIAAVTAVLCALAAGPAFAGKTLDAIKAKGFIQCGVSQGNPGFSNPDASGSWSGIDVDVCRAVAAAVFGDATKVKFTPTSGKDRFTALQSGEIDLLSRNTTWTLTRDTSTGLDFVAVAYYDGQGFMVKKSLNVKSAKELDGATVCVGAGTTTELNLQDYFGANNMKYTPVVFEKQDEVIAAYDAGRCDVLTDDQSGLYSQRIKLKSPEEHVVLPEIISKEPLGPIVRKGDQEWGDIVRWTMFGMIDAEELGIGSANVDELKAKSANPEIKRALGDSDFGKALGVSNDWLFNIVKQVGNYGESFERNLGTKSPLKIARGINSLWNKGGVLYAPPMR
jgi:general L-amino acid transport system substrate-binding protein